MISAEDLLAAPGQEPHYCYAMLNPLATPNPVLHWCEQEWASESIPLYIQTPMESILPASPWLLQIQPECLHQVLAWCDAQTSPSWGWLYASPQAWWAQRQHWQNYLRIVIDGDLRAVRFQDPRILSLWLAEPQEALWHGLLAPITTVFLSRKEIYQRPVAWQPLNDTFPWALPDPLSHAWHDSPLGQENKILELTLALWEQDPAQAEEWEAHAPLSVQLQRWLQAWLADGGRVREATLPTAQAWLKTRHNTMKRQA